MKRKNMLLGSVLVIAFCIITIVINYSCKADIKNEEVILEEEKKIIIEPLKNEMIINRPEKQNIKTSEKQITITGSSDPSMELKLNGEKVEVYYTGNFVKVVPLNIGMNELEFTLGKSKKLYKVDREFKIINSIAPSDKVQIEEGKEITITAKLYSGAKGTAIINGETIDLNQIESEEYIKAKDSTYAKFEGKYTPKTCKEKTSLGKIKISSEFEGKKEEGEGAEVIVTPKNNEDKKLATLINDSVKVYDDNTTSSIPLVESSPLPKGTIDYVLSDTIVDSREYYNLMSGERVKKEDVKINKNLPSPEGNTLSGISLYDDGKYTTLKIKSPKKVPFSLKLEPLQFENPSKGDYKIEKFDVSQIIISFNYTDGIDAIDYKENKLFSQVKGSGDEIILSLKEKGGYNGHFSFYDDAGDLNIRFHNRITKLEGANIILDPGHGYSGGQWKDSGALGWNSITENDLNVKITQLLEKELKSKGANVFRLPTEEKTYELKNRGKVAREKDGDLYISIHHNSGGAGKINATETFYNTPFSMELAEDINSSLVNCYEDTLFKRKDESFNRGAKNESFVVTLEKECPSVLVEAGYLDNPISFNKLIDEEYQKEIVKSIVEGIEKYCYNN